jgi:HAMP domain-containing protein
MPGGNAPANQRFHGRLARNTLAILLLLTLLPLLALGSATYLRTRGLLRDQIFSLLATVSQVQGDRISREVATGRQLLARAMADADVNQAMHMALEIDDRSSPEYLAARNQFFDQLKIVNQPKPYFSQFLVVNTAGEIQIATNRDWEGLKPTTLSRAASGNKQAESRIVYGLNPLYDQSLLILTSIPYLSPSGEALATIVGISEPNVIRDLMDRAVFFTQNSYIVPSKDTFIGINPYSDSFDKLIRYDPSQELLFYIEYLETQPTKSGVNELVSFQGEPVIAAYTWLPEMQTGWLTEITQASVYQQLNSLLVFLGILLGITLILLVGSSVLVTRYLVNPLTQLATSVSQFSSGNWEARTEIKRDDEVGLLASSFNQMASDLSVLYQSLEAKVEERTRQLQTSSELSQLSITAADLDELLSETVTLLAKRFGYPFAAIYLMDENNEFAVLRQAAASPEIMANLRGTRLKIEPLSLVGWVAMTGSTKVDLIGQGAFGAIDRQDLSTEARAEAGIPIIHAGRVLGVLVIQSTRPTHLNEETIHELQNLANQISPALQNFYLLEATQIDLQETNLLYQASHQIAQAENENQIYTLAREALD